MEVIDRASRGWRPYALLALLCLGLYLPGIAALPPLDRDEARFVQATRQMLQSGDFLRIRFQDEARNKKPAGIYWLQAAAVAGLSNADSTAIWPYRLPSLTGALAAVLLTFAFGARLMTRSAALLGAALLAASLGLTVEAHLAKTDAVLLALCVAAQGALGEIYRARGDPEAGLPAPGWALLFWGAQGLAILIKGPVAPLLSALTVLALSVADRDARWLRGLRAAWGVPLLVLIVAPWLVAIERATGGAFLGQSLGHDFFGKIVGAQESHGAPPGYYLLFLLFTFWPGSLFLGVTLPHAWRARRETAARFLIAWILPFWVVLELVPTKLPHYVLPAYPALALLAGQALTVAVDSGPRWPNRVVAALWGVVGLLFAVIFATAPLSLGRGIDAAGIVAGAVLLLFGSRLLIQEWRRPRPGLAARSVLLALLVTAPVIGLEAPTLDRLWLSRSAALIVAAHPPPPGVPVAAVGYDEPSLVFLLGTATRLVSPAVAAQEVAATPGAEALVESRDDKAFRHALTARGQQAEVVARAAGLDYSNGKTMLLTLYRGAPVSPAR